MDGPMSAARKPAEREVVIARSSFSLPSRYLEELESCSSPGVVSKKAAYFEEVIRSASTDKCSRKSTSRVNGGEIPHDGDETVRTLDFSSDSEECKEPTEVDAGRSGNIEQLEPAGRCADAVVNSEEEVLQATVLDGTESKIDVIVRDASGETTETHVEDAAVSPTELLKENKAPECENQNQEPTVSSHHNKKLDPVEKKTKKPVLQKEQHPVRSSASSLSRHRMCTMTSEVAPKKVSTCSSNPISRSTNFTTPQPFTLATERRKSVEVRMTIDISKTVKADQLASSSRSQIHSTIAKPAFKQSPKDHKSIGKPENQFRGTANGFHLKSEERAGKRKEFYTKLEERMSAKELEKKQLNAKIQEEMDTELRKLRQSLNFKARPMPRFYHEAPEPKSDQKKVPTTRAISPKLGRLNCKTSEGNSHHVRLCQQQALASGAGTGSVLKRTTVTLTASSDSIPLRKGSAAARMSRNSIHKRHSSEIVDSLNGGPGIDTMAAGVDLREEDEGILVGGDAVSDVGEVFSEAGFMNSENHFKSENTATSK